MTTNALSTDAIQRCIRSHNFHNVIYDKERDQAFSELEALVASNKAKDARIEELESEGRTWKHRARLARS